MNKIKSEGIDKKQNSRFSVFFFLCTVVERGEHESAEHLDLAQTPSFVNDFYILNNVNNSPLNKKRQRI